MADFLANFATSGLVDLHFISKGRLLDKSQDLAFVGYFCIAGGAYYPEVRQTVTHQFGAFWLERRAKNLVGLNLTRPNHTLLLLQHTLLKRFR